MSTVRTRRKPTRKPPAAEPAWEVAHLYPLQGQWSETEYFALPGNFLIDYEDGIIEVLPVPTIPHQVIVAFLFRLLADFVERHQLGMPLFAPARVRLWRGKFREPDVLFMLRAHADRVKREFWEGADLVMEIVSDDRKDRERDLVEKPLEYARARIPEYWIIDPKEASITVLKLKGRKYVVHGTFTPGQVATSALLGGFQVDVEAVLSAK
jgi:Uma2 family endonuclease